MNAYIEVPLTRGAVTLIDVEDADRVLVHKWRVQASHHTFYAVRTVCETGARQRAQLLHNLITGFIGVDHINGNGLDNRRGNLRAANVSERNRKRRKRMGASSRYKGVFWRWDRAIWYARITVHGRSLHLGAYPDEIAAAVAYDNAARLHFGDFAALNFPRVGEQCAQLDDWPSARTK